MSDTTAQIDEKTNALEQLVTTILGSFDTALTKPVVDGVSNFISHNNGLIAAVVTLYITLLGWRIMRGKTDGKQAMEAVAVLFFSLGFYYYLPNALPFINNIIDAGPQFLASAMLKASQSLATGISSTVGHGIRTAYQMIIQPDVAWHSHKLGLSLIGLVVMVVSLIFAILTISLVLVHKVKLKLLVLAMPVFVLLYIFNETRKLTEGYMQIIMTSLAALFLISLLMSALSLGHLGFGWDSKKAAMSVFVGVSQVIIMGVQLLLLKHVDTMATSIGGAWQVGVSTGAARAVDLVKKYKNRDRSEVKPRLNNQGR